MDDSPGALQGLYTCLQKATTVADGTAHIEALVRQLYRLGAVQREISRHALAELGTQGFNALAVIALHGPLRVSEVAPLLGVDVSVASRQVTALVSAGQVSRTPDGRDRRAHIVGATPAGQRVLRQSHRRMVSAFERVLTHWSDDDVRQLSAGLERLREDYVALSVDGENGPGATL